MFWPQKSLQTTYHKLRSVILKNQSQEFFTVAESLWVDGSALKSCTVQTFHLG